MIGMAAALVDAFALGDYVEKVVWAHGRAEGVAGAAVFLAAEVDGEGVLWVGFFFHVFGVPPVFFVYATKTQFWVTKWGGIVVWVDYTIWGWEGQGCWIYGRWQGVCCLAPGLRRGLASRLPEIC